ncbi:MAG: hypothetical protein AVDCRST_MAG64-4448 [uncultured Phycisphaerae bacterium]|uniref:PIN domain-containing protein n=1 Tax=uncultured Phycisphaerae bacterium TaxID=904963 RepID=A0A6J4QHD9_9BACT|nr:MAG: hypothetical protein AVDCRST_MAG64-4448 [uncultured Phycisphaerae bacterium]
MRAGYLLDTNHVGLAVRAGSAVQTRVLAAHRRGVRLGTCVPVLCEIEHGVQYIRHQDA